MYRNFTLDKLNGISKNLTKKQPENKQEADI